MLMASMLLFLLAFSMRGLVPAWGASGYRLLSLDGLPWLLDGGVPPQKAWGWALVITATVSPSCRPQLGSRRYSPIHLGTDIFMMADGEMPGRLAASRHQPVMWSLLALCMSLTASYIRRWGQQQVAWQV